MGPQRCRFVSQSRLRLAACSSASYCAQVLGCSVSNLHDVIYAFAVGKCSSTLQSQHGLLPMNMHSVCTHFLSAHASQNFRAGCSSAEAVGYLAKAEAESRLRLAQAAMSRQLHTVDKDDLHEMHLMYCLVPFPTKSCQVYKNRL